MGCHNIFHNQTNKTMRNIFKMLGVFCLMFVFMSCEDKRQEILPPAEKGEVKVIHNPNRTTADISVSGTATIPAGTYGYITIAPGANVTFSGGQTIFNSFIYTGGSYPGGAPVTITVPNTATVIMNHASGLYPGSTMTNLGSFHCKSAFYVGSSWGTTTFNNTGRFKCDDELVLHLNTTFNEGLFAYCRVNTLRTVHGNSRFVFTGLSSLHTPDITVDVVKLGFTALSSPTVALFHGKGKVNVHYVEIGGTYIKLTGSSTIKICTPQAISYQNGASQALSFGPGQLTCN